MIGCLVVGILILVAFAITPIILWPILIIVLVVVGVIAGFLGLLNGVIDVLFGRRRK
jgi:hypothetical protein